MSIETLVAAYEDAKSSMILGLREEFKKELKSFFESTPEIKAIVWNQYTPYFADGDPCEFSVNCVYFTNAESEILEENLNEISYGDIELEEFFSITSNSEYGRNWNDTPKQEPVSLEVQDSINGMVKKLNMIPYEVYLDMFGDHVIVTVTRDTITTSEYAHD